jgi:hypothetical protein
MNEREIVIAGQPFCRTCAGDDYYRPHDPAQA